MKRAFKKVIIGVTFNKFTTNKATCFIASPNILPKFFNSPLFTKAENSLLISANIVFNSSNNPELNSLPTSSTLLSKVDQMPLQLLPIFSVIPPKRVFIMFSKADIISSAVDNTSLFFDILMPCANRSAEEIFNSLILSTASPNWPLCTLANTEVTSVIFFPVAAAQSPDNFKNF